MRQPLARAPLLWAAVIGALGACSVPAYDIKEAPPAVVNSCKVDADCSGAICASGMCVVSVSPDVQKVVVEVVPPASAHFGAGSSFLIPVDAATAALDLTLPAYATVTGKVIYNPVLPDDAIPDGCRAADKSVALRVTARRMDESYGLPAFEVEGNASLEAAGWRYKLTLPPGLYDLYLTESGGCNMPPLFLKGQDFGKGAEYSWPIQIANLIPLTGPVQYAEPADLEGWSVVLIDPVEGKPVSTSQTFSPTVDPVKVISLRYADLTGQPVPLLKLYPPKGMVAPTLYWDVSVIDFDNDHKVGLDLSELQWSKATVRARVESSSNNAPVEGSSVTIRSTALAGVPQGLTAVYETTVASGPDGVIEANLVPGTYRVMVVPPDDTMAVRQEMWTVAASPDVQAGRTILLEPAIVATGVARERLQGTGLARADVDLVPWGKSPSVLEVALGKSSLMPRLAVSRTSEDGSFAVGADPGSFLLAVQTNGATGFPWIVRSGVEVKSEGPHPLSLGEMKASFPLAMVGTVRDAWGPVQNALVRAWLPLAANGSGVRTGDAAQGAIQIAESRSDNGGSYRLLLPSEVQR